MRKKIKQSVDVAAVTDAWNAFFERKNTHSVEELNRDGWLDIYTVSENMDISPRTIYRSAKKMGLEEKVFRVMWKGSSREVRFFRIK